MKNEILRVLKLLKDTVDFVGSFTVAKILRVLKPQNRVLVKKLLLLHYNIYFFIAATIIVINICFLSYNFLLF